MGRIMTVIFMAMMLAGCAYTHALPPEGLAVQKVLDVPGASRERIIDKSKIWFARTFRQPMTRWEEQNSRRTVLQYENEGKGLLIASAAIPYPHEGFTSESYKTGWEVRFTLEVNAKEGRARVTFSRLTMFVPSIICDYYSYATSSYERPPYEDEFEKAKPAFLDLADQLGAYLTAPEEKW